MKNFIRSTAGKTILFIICIISFCIFAGSMAASAILLQDDLDFYTRSEEDIRREYLADSVRGYGYDYIWSALQNDREYGSGNIYRIKDSAGTTVFESAGAAGVKKWDYTCSYNVIRDGENITEISYMFAPGYTGPEGTQTEQYTVELNFPEGSAAAGKLELLGRVIHIAWVMRYTVFAVLAASLLITICSFVALMSASGRRPDTEEICPGPLNRIPFDLLTVGCMGIGILAVPIADEIVRDTDYVTFLIAGMLCVAGLNVLLGLCMSASARIKQRTFIKNTVIFMCLKWCWNVLCWFWGLLVRLHNFNMTLIRNMPLVSKAVLAVLGLSFAEMVALLAAGSNNEGIMIMFFLEKIILIPCFIYFVLCLRRLEAGGGALAAGDLAYQTDTRGMFWDLRKHGDNLNSIARGMAVAVDERTKSERMKAQLITNVSHDIKTPLTSIINYASLISQEPAENEKIKEYSEVLVRQSEKLKRLLEDLVEASRASSGNMEVSMAPCDASVFITQAAGEYEEKLNASQLTLITKHPEKKIMIMADGRRMWRIFDNLMNNICKYAQPGTRVYLTLEEDAGNAVITFKNTSRDELDMSEEELLERFTRGDASRNTEGNGLGLSIARSMAELQNGTLRVFTDGDLFKAVLTFPAVM